MDLRKSLILCHYIIKTDSCSVSQKYKRAVVLQDYKTLTSYINFCAYFLAFHPRLWWSGKDSLSTDVTNYHKFHERHSDTLIMSGRWVKEVIAAPFL